MLFSHSSWIQGVGQRCSLINGFHYWLAVWIDEKIDCALINENDYITSTVDAHFSWLRLLSNRIQNLDNFVLIWLVSLLKLGVIRFSGLLLASFAASGAPRAIIRGALIDWHGSFGHGKSLVKGFDSVFILASFPLDHVDFINRHKTPGIMRPILILLQLQNAAKHLHKGGKIVERLAYNPASRRFQP